MDLKLQNKLVLTVKRYIANYFQRSNWNDLAYITNGEDIVHEHARLIQSLYHGDDDYDEIVLEVISSLIRRDNENLYKIIDYIELPTWLEENEPKLYAELFGNTHPLLGDLTKIATTNSFELSHHIDRIRRSVDLDPELAVGSMKEMLESVFKSILNASGETITNKDDFPKLLNKVQKILKLDPNDLKPNAKGGDLIKRTLSNLSQVALGIDELRNFYGTGHGRIQYSGITSRHARLVVGAGASLAVFLLETFEYHQQKK